MSSSITSIIPYVLAFSIISTAFAAKQSLCPFEYIYQFGDSLADTGNRIRQAGVTSVFNISTAPYGMTYFHKPTGRFSNGLLVIDFIAKALHLPLLHPYLETNGSFDHGANFAVAGSTALDNTFFAKRNITLPSTNIPLRQQLKWFKKHVKSVSKNPSESRRRLRRALIIMGEIGGNDLNNAFSHGESIEEISRVYVPSITEAICNAVREVIQLGAIYIVVPGNIPGGCLPKVLTEFPSTDRKDYDDKGCLRRFNNFALFYNDYLERAIASVRLEFPDAVIQYFDYYKAFQSTLHRANHLGFDQRSLLKACCGIGGKYNYNDKKVCGSHGVKACHNPAKFMNWDGIHPTQETYRHISDRFIDDVLSKIKCQM